jgi:hypothetical protein
MRKRTRLGLVDVLEDTDGLDQGLTGLVVDVSGDKSERLDLEVLLRPLAGYSPCVVISPLLSL